MDLGLGSIGLIVVLVGLAVSLVPILFASVFLIVVVSNRADPDPSGRRPAAVYAYAVSFVTLFTTLFATVLAVAALASLIGPHHSSAASPFDGDDSDDGSSDDGSDSGTFPLPSVTATSSMTHAIGDAAARDVVLGLLVALIAFVAYQRHDRGGRRLTAGIERGDPAGRVRSSYIAAVQFVCVILMVVSSIVAVYQVFRMIAPGVFNTNGHGSHETPLRVLVPTAFLAVAASGIRRRAGGELPPELRLGGGGWTPSQDT